LSDTLAVHRRSFEPPGGAWVHLELLAAGCLPIACEALECHATRCGQHWDGLVASEHRSPEHGALEININAALDYDGPYDPVLGSSDIRELAGHRAIAGARGPIKAGLTLLSPKEVFW
jgi:hypothetical protein